MKPVQIDGIRLKRVEVLEILPSANKAPDAVAIECSAIDKNFLFSFRHQLAWKIEFGLIERKRQIFRLHPVTPFNLITEFLTRPFIG